MIDWDDDCEDDICDCEYEDYDVIEGTATCYKCWSKRHVSSEEWRRIEKAQAEYDLMCEEWDKEQPVASGEPIGVPFSELASRPGNTSEQQAKYENFKRIARSWGYD